MTAWPIAEYHSVTSPTCTHIGKHQKDKEGRLRFDAEGHPLLDKLGPVTCNSQCEMFLINRLMFSNIPPIVKPRALREKKETPKQKEVVLAPPSNNTIIPLLSRGKIHRET